MIETEKELLRALATLGPLAALGRTTADDERVLSEINYAARSER
jgi:hypothetical protein